LLLFLWTLGLLAALSLLPKPLPVILLSAFVVSLAGFPLWHAQHVTWRAFLMMWLAVHVVFAATSIRISRRQIVTAAASALGFLWIGFQGGGTYSWYAQRTLLAAVAGAVLVAISAGMMLLASEHRAVVRRRDGVVSTAEPEPEPADAAAIVPGLGESGEAESSEVFAERIGLYVVPATAADAFRFMVRRDIARLPDHVLDVLGGVAAIDPDGSRDRLIDAAAGYLAGRDGDPAFGATARYWVTRDTYTEVEEASDQVAGALPSVVSFPIEVSAGEIGILEPVTGALAEAAQVCLITGVVGGAADGLRPLALRYATMQGHSAVEQVLDKAVAVAVHDMLADAVPGTDTNDWTSDLFGDEPSD
jgi:hypothetical protein